MLFPQAAITPPSGIKGCSKLKNDKASKIICICFAALLLALMVVPFAGMIFGGGSGTSAEKRNAAEFPALIKDGGANLSFGTEFEAWFRDRFALRSELTQADAEIKLGLFNTSPEDDVVAGKDGWLFYADTVPDFCREERLTEIDFLRLVTVIRLESEYARSRGAGYVFAVAPNKNSIYPEMMPAGFTVQEKDSLSRRLIAALKAQGVPVADLEAALLEAKNSGKGPLYYTGDSHWNLLGSNIAAEALHEAFRGQSRFSAGWSLRDLSAVTAGMREDDLLGMVQPMKSTRYEEFALDSSPDRFTASPRMRSLDDLIIRTRSDAPIQLRLLCSRDSFGRALVKPLSESFREAVFTRNSAFDIAGEIDEKTVVIREIVERNVPNLLKTAPVTEAPKVGEAGEAGEAGEDAAASPSEDAQASPSDGTEAFPVPVNVREAPDVVWFKETAGAMVHYYGYAAASEAQPCGRIFVKTEDGGMYEASPIIEEKLLTNLKAKADEVCGFSFYLAEDAGDVLGVTC